MFVIIKGIKNEQPAVKVRMPRIELGKSAGEVVGEDFVGQPQSLNVVDQSESANLNPPGLIIDASDGQNDLFAFKTRKTETPRLYLLNILRKIKHGITAR